MINYPVKVSASVGDVVSRAVEKFAKDNGLDYDLWYHDEPLWFIRKESQVDLGRKLVRRLQIAVFDTPQGTTLKVIPDVYVLPKNAQQRDKKTVDAGLRAKYSVSRNVRDLFSKDPEHELRTILDDSWRRADELTSYVK